MLGLKVRLDWVREFSTMAATMIYQAHPAMFRAHPFWFILFVLLIAAFGLGLLILLYWYIKTRATALTVTEHELLYEKGILSKERLSVSLRHVRSVQINQSFVNRILGVGTVRSPRPATSRNSGQGHARPA